MQSFTAGQSNKLTADLVNRSTGAPITSGTVNGYVKAMSGSDSGKWWSGTSFTAVEAAAGAMTPDADGHWEMTIAAGAWTTGVRYKFYPKESGDLHVTYSEEVVEITTPTTLTVEATVTD